ncbi:hypothetical protein U1Q18_023891 [Sarracenia purpurea var. burkii]
MKRLVGDVRDGAQWLRGTDSRNQVITSIVMITIYWSGIDSRRRGGEEDRCDGVSLPKVGPDGIDGEDVDLGVQKRWLREEDYSCERRLGERVMLG